MSYKVIEKNEYGIRVRNYSEIPDCKLCKNHAEKNTCNRSECAPNSYYLPDSEAEKLESENQLMNTTIDDLYIESKCYFEVKKKLDNSQKELIALQIENKQLKDRIKELEGTIENMKAISLQKEEVVNGITSVDYQSDKETELVSEIEEFFGDEITIKKTGCCNVLLFGGENYCPNCGRKIIR